MLRLFAALLLLAPVQTVAQDTPVVTRVERVADPQFAQPDDPWIYRGTDIPVDRQWLFGEMPNGLRYAVRRNGVPPNQVSIRIRIDAGSLHERDSEQGFAHLIEHLTFRESKYLAAGQAIPTWQRLGATFGSDTNAETTPTQTVYKLDLPDARNGALAESMKLLTGMIREPALSASNLAADVPIVLAERRERSGPEMRISDATRETFFSGLRLEDRAPIGTTETLQGATPEAVRAFHSRWYRPENTVVVVVGDADPLVLAQMVEDYFADWDVPGTAETAPDFGRPSAPAGAIGNPPVGKTSIMVEPGLPRGLTFAYLRPWVEVTDNLEYNRGLLIDAIAEAIINRRLESRARAGGNFLYASVQQDKISRSLDGTFVTLAPLSEDWEQALADVREVIADAMLAPPSQEEIDREVAEFDVTFANQVEQEAIQAGGQLADDIVTAVDIREAVAAPQTIYNVFRNMRDRFTPDEVFEHTQDLFEGEVVRALYMTPDAAEASEASLAAAIGSDVQVAGDTRQAAQTVSFDDLPPIGTPTQPSVREPIGIFEIERLTFPNGVRALVWNSGNEPGRVTVRVRFGAGRRAIGPDQAAYAELGEMALVSAGVGPLGQEELDQIATGRKFGFDFDIEDGTFVFEGRTRQADLADQLYLFAAKLAMPGWDANPIQRAKASSLLAYNAYNSNPNGVLSRDLSWLVHDRDPRYATPTPDQMEATTPEGFRAVWEPLLKQGPVEVAVFGDIDVEQTVAALSRTFGALPPREQIPPMVLAQSPGFPAPDGEATILRHNGEADQAAAVIGWPTGGGSAGLRESRKLEVLSELFGNRLLEAMREHAGASYAPQVGSDWPLDVRSGGHILALAQLPPDQVQVFFDEAETIASDLATQGPTDDELARVTEPLRQLMMRLQTGHTFWLNELEGASFDPNRVELLPTLMMDYTEVTPQEIRALAAKYLGNVEGWRLAVLPQESAAQISKR